MNRRSFLKGFGSALVALNLRLGFQTLPAIPKPSYLDKLQITLDFGEVQRMLHEGKCSDMTCESIIGNRVFYERIDLRGYWGPKR